MLSWRAKRTGHTKTRHTNFSIYTFREPAHPQFLEEALLCDEGNLWHWLQSKNFMTSAHLNALNFKR